ncbi:MAG TPA: carboxypeptidase-like regulatory domain-containing protein, partial [Verrucomicrobiota bacterium]|nr:carboxypeptidase-like regulatory domain-containing protein [Verrucomicrobiota bacterium]
MVKGAGTAVRLLALFLGLLAARSEADGTEVFSPVVSYLFPEAAGGAGEEVFSPVVSYLFPELPDDPGLRLATLESPRVSYFFNVGRGGPVSLGGVVVDRSGQPLPNATITLRAFDAGRTVISGTDGRYLM